MKPQITQINAYKESGKTGNATIVGRNYYVPRIHSGTGIKPSYIEKRLAILGESFTASQETGYVQRSVCGTGLVNCFNHIVMLYLKASSITDLS